jgi:hypothetical protein
VVVAGRPRDRFAAGVGVQDEAGAVDVVQGRVVDELLGPVAGGGQGAELLGAGLQGVGGPVEDAEGAGEDGGADVAGDVGPQQLAELELVGAEGDGAAACGVPSELVRKRTLRNLRHCTVTCCALSGRH